MKLFFILIVDLLSTGAFSVTTGFIPVDENPEFYAKLTDVNRAHFIRKQDLLEQVKVYKILDGFELKTVLRAFTEFSKNEAFSPMRRCRTVFGNEISSEVCADHLLDYFSDAKRKWEVGCALLNRTRTEMTSGSQAWKTSPLSNFKPYLDEFDRYAPITHRLSFACGAHTCDQYILIDPGFRHMVVLDVFSFRTE